MENVLRAGRSFRMGRFQTWVKNVIYLDSNTFLHFTELAWCIGTYEIVSKKGKACFLGLLPICTRRDQSSTKSICMQNNDIFDPGVENVRWHRESMITSFKKEICTLLYI